MVCILRDGCLDENTTVCGHLSALPFLSYLFLLTYYVHILFVVLCK